MDFLEIFILIFFVFFTGYFPGRLITNFLPLKKQEKVVLSFAISFFLFYILGFLSYIFNVNFAIFNDFFLLLFLILSIPYVALKDFDFEEIKLLRNFLITFLIFVIYQFFIPLYFGGLFSWDWFEHYLRSVFFLDRLPKDIVFEGYIIPSRPPFFNIVCFFIFQSLEGNFINIRLSQLF
ncbi:MAG: hypothetical protein ACK4F0_01850 [Candidatus Ratteibacteria bacterium]